MNGVRRDAEYRGDGVNGEDEVCYLDDDEHEQQQRPDLLAVLDREELLALVVARDGDVARDEAHDGVVFGVNVGLLLPEHLEARVDEEDAEDVYDPVEALDERRAQPIIVMRMTSAPSTPQKSTRCWYFAGTLK
jgi:hypothetical protein